MSFVKAMYAKVRSASAKRPVYSPSSPKSGAPPLESTSVAHDGGDGAARAGDSDLEGRPARCRHLPHALDTTGYHRGKRAGGIGFPYAKHRDALLVIHSESRHPAGADLAVEQRSELGRASIAPRFFDLRSDGTPDGSGTRFALRFTVARVRAATARKSGTNASTKSPLRASTICNLMPRALGVIASLAREAPRR